MCPLARPSRASIRLRAPCAYQEKAAVVTSAAVIRSATKSRYHSGIRMWILLIRIQYMQIRRESTVVELGTSVSGARFSLSPFYSWD